MVLLSTVVSLRALVACELRAPRPKFTGCRSEAVVTYKNSPQRGRHKLFFATCGLQAMSGPGHDRAVDGRRGRVGLLQRPRLFPPLHRDAEVGEKQDGRQFFTQAN